MIIITFPIRFPNKKIPKTQGGIQVILVDRSRRNPNKNRRVLVVFNRSKAKLILAKSCFSVKMGKGDLGKTDLVTREHTIHLAKLLHRVTFKKKTPRAIRAIKKFASTAMGTSDVRIAPALNKALWSRGVRHTPRRIRVRLSRKRNDDEEADEALFTLVEHVPVADFKELETKVVDEIAEDE